MVHLTVAVSYMFHLTKQNKLPQIIDRLLLMPACTLSKQIKDGSLTSVKLCQVYTERIKQINPLINAMVQDRFKQTFEHAQRIDQLLASFRSGKPEGEFSSDELVMLHSPLLGVPISVKESIKVKDMGWTCGAWHRRHISASEDAVVVRNACRFGMVPICTTNIPECTLYWADCQNKIYGRTKNPYDFSRVTGGSSGGEGALLGAGASVIGIGSDAAGSLRIPAHYCGIYSHKASPFLVSSEGNYPVILESRLRLFSMGPMCRYASDLRPLLRCLMSDKDNLKLDTYHKYQPENIASLREEVMQKLDEPVDLSQVQAELMEGQQEVIDHFRSKYNCQVEQINLDKYLKKAIIIWQCLHSTGGLMDRDISYTEDELERTFGINSVAMELLKMPFGLSKHTKESLLTFFVGKFPRDRTTKVYPLCEKFEKYAAQLKAEMEATLGDAGVLIMPTMPTVAYKHNVALLKSPDIRFTAMLNNLQLPVSHATLRLDKKHKLPFGFSLAAKPYNDQLTLACAEEIELAFGGWTPPTTISADPTSHANNNNGK